MTNFNELNNQQAEALSLLAEEAAEVIQCVTKILRHGLNSYNPTIPHSPTNREDLAKELGHLAAARQLCQKYVAGIHDCAIGEYMDHKIRTLHGWLHHADAENLPGTVVSCVSCRPRSSEELTPEEKILQRLKEGFGGEG